MLKMYTDIIVSDVNLFGNVFLCHISYIQLFQFKHALLPQFFSETIIKAVLIFAEGIFEGESHVV